MVADIQILPYPTQVSSPIALVLHRSYYPSSSRSLSSRPSLLLSLIALIPGHCSVSSPIALVPYPLVPHLLVSRRSDPSSLFFLKESNEGQTEGQTQRVSNAEGFERGGS